MPKKTLPALIENSDVLLIPICRAPHTGDTLGGLAKIPLPNKACSLKLTTVNRPTLYPGEKLYLILTDNWELPTHVYSTEKVPSKQVELPNGIVKTVNPTRKDRMKIKTKSYTAVISYGILAQGKRTCFSDKTPPLRTSIAWEGSHTPELALIGNVASSKFRINGRQQQVHKFCDGLQRRAERALIQYLHGINVGMVMRPTPCNLEEYPVNDFLIGSSHSKYFDTNLLLVQSSQKSPINISLRKKIKDNLPIHGFSGYKANIVWTFINPRVMGHNFPKLSRQQILSLFAPFNGYLNYRKNNDPTFINDWFLMIQAQSQQMWGNP